MLKIKKISRLSICQKLGNQTPDFGCPDENLVVLQGSPQNSVSDSKVTVGKANVKVLQTTEAAIKLL